jgi:membrane protein YdbS with pleckstrin-like domain
MTRADPTPAPADRAKRVYLAAAWIYEGLWGILASWFCVPREAPSLPLLPGEELVAIRASAAWLRYLKFWFWLGLTILDGVLILFWLGLCFTAPLAGVATAPLVWFIAIVPDIFVYIALLLKYDTTWYVLTPRSIRLRNGIWTIRETTFTFENVQNIAITQGPVERWFGFANVKVETAGGGVIRTDHGAMPDGSNVAYLYGLENAREIRELIMKRVALSRTAGLGDEHHPHAPGAALSEGATFGPEHLAELRAIRDRLRAAQIALS